MGGRAYERGRYGGRPTAGGGVSAARAAAGRSRGRGRKRGAAGSGPPKLKRVTVGQIWPAIALQETGQFGPPTEQVVRCLMTDWSHSWANSWKLGEEFELVERRLGPIIGRGRLLSAIYTQCRELREDHYRSLGWEWMHQRPELWHPFDRLPARGVTAGRFSPELFATMANDYGCVYLVHFELLRVEPKARAEAQQRLERVAAGREGVQ